MAKQQISQLQINNPYRFRVFRNAAWTPGAGENLIPFDSKSYDPNNNFNLSTFKYTVPVKGVYFFTGRTSVNANTRDFLNLNVNDVLRARGGDVTGNAPPGVTIATDLELNAGDEVTLLIYTTVGGSVEVDSTRTYFTGRLIQAT